MISRHDHSGNFQPKLHFLMNISYLPMFGLQLAFGFSASTPARPVAEAE